MSRTVWKWDPDRKALVEVARADVRPRLEINTDGHYDGLRTPEGVNIGSRRRHRDHMKAHGLSLASEHEADWRRAEKERANYAEVTRKERREEVERIAYELEMKRRKVAAPLSREAPGMPAWEDEDL